MPVESQKKWGKILIQGTAAIQPATTKQIMTLLGVLKSIKPSQKLSSNETAVAITKIASLLHEDGYDYKSIDDGINQLLRTEQSDFFSNPATLIKYIYPIHWAKRKRLNQIEEIIEREIEKERS